MNEILEMIEENGGVDHAECAPLGLGHALYMVHCNSGFLLYFNQDFEATNISYWHKFARFRLSGMDEVTDHIAIMRLES